MKAEVLDLEGKKTGEVEMPTQFSEPVRKDLIKRAVLSVRSRAYQPKGADPEAGTRQGFATPKRRHKFKTVYGRGVSRVRRKRMMRRGTQIHYVAAFLANVVKGKKVFAPQADKNILERINKKEKRKAIRSALAASLDMKIVKGRGHVAEKVPLVVEDKFESLDKTKDVKKTLLALGLEKELERTDKVKIKAGRGKMRGRRYTKKVGPLLVTAEKDAKVLKAGKNILGVEAVDVKSLNAELLAPGTDAGRLVVWSKAALEKMSKEGLFQ